MPREPKAIKTKFILLDFSGTVAQYDPSIMDVVYNFLFNAGIMICRRELGNLVYRTNYYLWSLMRLNEVEEDHFWQTALSFLKKESTSKSIKDVQIERELLDITQKYRKDAGNRNVQIDHSGLSKIASFGPEMGILSNWLPTLGDYCRSIGIRQFFRFILASEAMGVAKPNIQAFQMAIDQIGLKASEILYIGDNYYIDYLSAGRAGLRPLLMDPKGWYGNFKCRKIECLKDALEFIK